MSSQKPPKRLVIRWATLKGLIAIILFLIIAVLIEYLVVLYGMRLGVEEKPESKMFGLISPLFHLVPAAVVIALMSSWIYLTRHAAVKHPEIQKGKGDFKHDKKQRLRGVRKFFGRIKSGLLKVKGITYVWQKIHFARATIKSALTIILVFSALILLVSVLAYPQLIYQTIVSVYKANLALLNFVKGTSQALAPLGEFFAGVNNALLAVAPGFRNFVLALGSIFEPLVRLDSVGKYLVFQNVAAWIAALVALVYGQYLRKSYRYRKSRRS
ncbi:MAG: hypothetical protein QHH18_00335 [Candidatus Bathyarchaeota archaeon]|nr:hypothetical protein [Candidatus Bathyarchaeota archaeon A05DMB-5]MDH7557041.1 hypothetical protein [Candidatus Bathyarchaeota archaeon]